MRCDVAIVGAGPAGTILARALNRAGLSVVLLERGRHPRFALGESSTPIAALALERLAVRFDLPDLHDLAAYGRWTRRLPALRRGLKRGFSFYHHRPERAYANGTDNAARLLVAASPNRRVADAHWLRADVDHHLVRRAVAEGVRYLDRADVVGVVVGRSGARLEARGREPGDRRTVRVHAGIVVDGTGRTGPVARAAGAGDRTDRMPVASGLLFAHLRGVPDFAEVARSAGASIDPGPFPDDRAAVHHLLAEGWMYQLSFDHGTTSVGLLIDAAEAGFDPTAAATDPAAAARALIDRYPTLASQLRGAAVEVPWRLVERVQHRRARAAGPGWFLLPHTFAFVDPLFSTGIAWSLIAVERLVDVITGRFGDARGYDALLRREADAVERLVAGAYRTRGDFARFTPQTMLYFAAVSFEEAHQRLVPANGAAAGARPDAWRGFLGVHDPARRRLFADALDRLARSDGDPAATERFAAWVAERIAPFDVGGFFAAGRRNLHPLDLDLLIERSSLFGLETAAVRAALPRLRGGV